METVTHLIAGEMVSHSNETIEVFNPATGAVTCLMEMGNQETVQQAIRAAEAALPAWKKTPPLKRARVMYRFKELLEANKDTIAKLISKNMEKPFQMH